MNSTAPPTRAIRPRMTEPAVLIGLGLLAFPLALAAASRPGLVLVVVVALVVVGVCAARADLALLLLVATAPLEVLLPGGSGGGLTVTKVAGALCFTSFALSAVVALSLIHI